MIKLQEPKVSVLCRQQDLNLVKSVVGAAKAEFQSKCNMECDLTVDEKLFLPPGPELAGNSPEVWYD